jgi:hypothetical protein
VFSVEVVVLGLVLRDWVWVWVWVFCLRLGVFDDLDRFRFLRTGLRFRGTGSEVLFTEVFDLLFAGLSLL